MQQSIVFLLRVQCRRKESSRSLSHLLMSFLLKSCCSETVANFVEICNVCARKAIIEAAKRIINSDKVCHSYSDLNFGVTFLEHSVYTLCSYIALRGWSNMTNSSV